jgi:hypothetical protein
MHKEALPGGGQISGQGTRSELACPLVSGRVKANVVTAFVKAEKISGGYM